MAFNRLAVLRELVKQTRADAAHIVLSDDDFVVRRLQTEIVNLYDDVLSLKRFSQGGEVDSCSDQDLQ